jgi:pimeloyl-ACP methyl ester carboxylesterase
MDDADVEMAWQFAVSVLTILASWLVLGITCAGPLITMGRGAVIGFGLSAVYCTILIGFAGPWWTASAFCLTLAVTLRTYVAHRNRRRFESIWAATPTDPAESPPSAGHILVYAHGHGSPSDAAIMFWQTGDWARMRCLDMAAAGGKGTYRSPSLLAHLSRCYVGGAPFPLAQHVVAVDTAHGRANYNLGGQRDAELYADAVRHLLEEHRSAKLVLMGSGRGGATVWNALTLLAQQRDWPAMRDRIALVLLCAPYARADEAAAHRLSYATGTWLAEAVTPWIMRHLLPWIAPRYDSRWDPLARTALYPTDVPTLLLNSADDAIVPPAAARQLCDAVLQRAPTAPVRHVPFKRSGHNVLISSAGEDATAAIEALKPYLAWSGRARSALGRNGTVSTT